MFYHVFPFFFDQTQTVIYRLGTQDSCFTSVVAEHTWLQNAKKAPNVPLGDIVKSRLKQFSRMNRFKRRALRV
jgi:hypothetical protein